MSAYIQKIILKNDHTLNIFDELQAAKQTPKLGVYRNHELVILSVKTSNCYDFIIQLFKNCLSLIYETVGLLNRSDTAVQALKETVTQYHLLKARKSLDPNMEKLEQDLVAKNATLQQLNQRVSEVGATLTEKARQVEQKQIEATDLDTRIGQLGNALALKQTEQTALQELLSQKKQQQVELETLQQTLDVAITAKQTELAVLTESNEEQKQRNLALNHVNTTLAARENELEPLRNQLEQQTTLLGKNQARISQLEEHEAVINQLNQKKAKLNERINSLNTKIAAYPTKETAFNEGHRQGYASGETQGFKKGMNEGLTAGQKRGYRQGEQTGQAIGLKEGKTEGRRSFKYEAKRIVEEACKNFYGHGQYINQIIQQKLDGYWI